MSVPGAPARLAGLAFRVADLVWTDEDTTPDPIYKLRRSGPGPRNDVESGPQRPREPRASGPYFQAAIAPVSMDLDLRRFRMDATTLRARRTPEVRRSLRPDQSGALLPASPDPVLQTSLAAASMPPASQSFNGMQFNGWIPPDPNGDVGPNHYIQAVNASIQIFNKDGSSALGPVTFDTLFATAPAPCSSRNQGDPIVVYDPVADRWLVSDVAWSSSFGPFYQCIAVSKTANPVTGGWWLYTVKTHDSYLADYPKFGVWSDGYYMSANMWQLGAGDSFKGARVWAFNRDEAINGLPLNPVAFDVQDDGGLLPANVRGTPPAAGSPALFADIEPAPLNAVHLWRFHVDWATPSNSTFTGPVALPVPPFATFPIGSYVIPQGGSTETLDQIDDRLMMQAQYRRLGGGDSLWLNHTVASSGAAAVRWYQVHDPGGTPGISQMGTYQPDPAHRWNASLAVDAMGNMAIGYSVSSASMYPAIRYAGRLATDPPGLLQAETSLIEGTGSQRLAFNRWGDYSAMSVDPVDDCTFWYTNQYYQSTGSSWRTRIGSFRFPNCGVNPVPGITGLGPSTLTAGSAGFSLAVLGAGFRAVSSVLWNGSPRETTYVSGSELRAAISASDVANVGAATVTVFNPAPGGGSSNARTFVVTRATATLSLGATTFTYDGGPKPVSVGTNPPGLGGINITYDGSADPPALPGSYRVVATLVNPDYQASAVSGTLTIDAGIGPAAADDLAPGVDGSVHAIAVQPDGKTIVGGEFRAIGGVARSGLARLNRDGSIDTAFDPATNGPVLALAVLPDGRILAAGDFTSIAGVARGFIARLESTGQVDLAFDPGANGAVHALLPLPDGRLIAGGDFTQIAGDARGHIARLNADGSLDTRFTAQADNAVRALAAQHDGRVIAGGAFVTLNGAPRPRMARLMADGSLDATFNPGADADVLAVVVQPDGRLIVAGDFAGIGEVAGVGPGPTVRRGLARLLSDGSIDPGFDAHIEGGVSTLALQVDGGIIAGGSFESAGGATRHNIARLRPDGSLDATFNAGASGPVTAVALEADGRILASGGFNIIGARERHGFARVDNTAGAFETLQIDAAGIVWLRGGTGPEFGDAGFDGSADGATWLPLGAATRINGGWAVDRPALPRGTHYLRGRGQYGSGRYDGSGSAIEWVRDLRELGDRPIIVTLAPLPQDGEVPTRPLDTPFGKRSPGRDATVPGNIITVSWSPAHDATRYRLCVDTIDNDVCDGRWLVVRSSTSRVLSGMKPGTYYWQVLAERGGETTVADGGVWYRFVVVAPPNRRQKGDG